MIKKKIRPSIKRVLNTRSRNNPIHQAHLKRIMTRQQNKIPLSERQKGWLRKRTVAKKIPFRRIKR